MTAPCTLLLVHDFLDILEFLHVSHGVKRFSELIRSGCVRFLNFSPKSVGYHTKNVFVIQVGQGKIFIIRGLLNIEESILVLTTLSSKRLSTFTPRLIYLLSLKLSHMPDARAVLIIVCTTILILGVYLCSPKRRRLYLRMLNIAPDKAYFIRETLDMS